MDEQNVEMNEVQREVFDPEEAPPPGYKMLKHEE